MVSKASKKDRQNQLGNLSVKDPTSKMDQQAQQLNELDFQNQDCNLDDDDFGEGETEDTQIVNVEGSMAAAQQMQTPHHQKSNSLALKQSRQQSETKNTSNRSRSSRRETGTSSKSKLPPFQSPYSRQLIESFPQRTRWEIPQSKIVFSSEFCSGNMSKAQRGYQKDNFDIWVACDAAPHMEGEYYRTWFYFSVTGVPQGDQLTFTFKNLSNQTKLYNQGLKPTFRVMPTHQQKWRRIMTKATTYFNSDDQFTMQFNHMFAYPEKETTYFAFTFPFSYQESIELTDQIQHKLQNQSNCYFNREILYYSLEGRPMELVTISSRDLITEEHETIPENGKGCFPAAEKDPKTRSLRFDKRKQVIFLTSRVHPGETPGSHVLNGFLEMLCDLRSEIGRCLRKNFVFKVIMMLNPDGVSRGYYRLDTMACNLNRMYLNPSKTDNPTIWATRCAVVQQAEQYQCLKIFLDFHAHASKRGGFMFGNHIKDEEKQADNITFVKLIAMNCLNFDMNECNFSDKIMAVKDRNGQSREGSSRVALAKATGLTYCYTLEFNYHSGRRINTLAPKYARTTGTIEAETELTDPQSKIYANQASPPFTREIFEDCGRALGSALLDLIEDNPISRIPLSCYRTINNVRTDILNHLQKYESGNVNVVGANHFAPTNTKVAKAFANTPGPRIKLNGSAGNAASKAEQIKLQKAASLLTAPNKQKHGTFGVTKRLLEDSHTTASTKNNRGNDTSVTKEKKNSASLRNPNVNAQHGGGGGKSRQTNTCNSASQQPPPSRGTINRLHQPNSAKQKAKKDKSGTYLQQSQLGQEASFVIQQPQSSTSLSQANHQQQQLEAAALLSIQANNGGQRLSDLQIQQLHQYHLALQQQQMLTHHQQQQQTHSSHYSTTFGNNGAQMVNEQHTSQVKVSHPPAFLMSQQTHNQSNDQQNQRLFMQNQIAQMQTKMGQTEQFSGISLNQQQNQDPRVAQMSMQQQQMLHQQMIAQKQQQLQLQQQQHQSRQHQISQQQYAAVAAQQKDQQQNPERMIIRVANQQTIQAQQKQQQDQSLMQSTKYSQPQAETNSLSLPNPNGMHYAISAQQKQMGSKIRSKTHIRSDMHSNNATQEISNSGQKRSLKQQPYSPCPKIPSAIDAHDSQQLQQHHQHDMRGGSLVPLSNTEEKGSAGRRSARHYQEHQNSSDKKNSSNFDVRSVNGSVHHKQQRIEMMSGDPYDRKSFDSKGQAVHRSAMHVKNTAMLAQKIANQNYDQHGLHNNKNSMIEHNYLPNISPNYTSANVNNNINSKDYHHHSNMGGTNNVANTMQSSSRTLTSIPHIMQSHHGQAPPSQMSKNVGQHSPQIQVQQQTDFINHRSLKPGKKPVFSTQQQNQLSLMNHKRNQGGSKASLQQFAPKQHDSGQLQTAQHLMGAAANCNSNGQQPHLRPPQKQVVNGSGKPPIMNQACLFKTPQNNMSMSAQATLSTSGPHDPDLGVVVNHVSSNINTPSANAMLLNAHAAMVEHQKKKQKSPAERQTRSKQPKHLKQQRQSKQGTSNSQKEQNLHTTQSVNGNLKLTSAASVGGKKPMRIQQSKVGSSHSHKEKIIL